MSAPPEHRIVSGMKRRGVWSIAWAQLIGARHRITEDSVAFRLLKRENPGGLHLALADGVGGGARGDVAAQALAAHCVEAPGALLGKPGDLAKWMGLAEAQVQLRLREVTFSPGASTIAAAWLGRDGQGHWLHIGDCRIYRQHAGGLECLTQDHTYQQTGEPPPRGVSADSPSRMVGTGHAADLQPKPLRLLAGEALLLCSDGLHKGLEEDTMLEYLAAPSRKPEDACVALAQAARRAGSEDDISVLWARWQPRSGGGWWSWLR